jgi:undecaprenyl phosphate-alpha-L-ara4FN deformylase
MNQHALRLEQRMGFRYCSDTRGSTPFIPIWHAEIIACPQLPTTLPTLDELIGANDITESNVVSHLLQMTENPASTGHVYTLHAELEGMKLAAQFEQMLEGWKAQGYSLTSLADYFSVLDIAQLPHHEVVMDSLPGRSGTLACQGPKFLE